MATIINTPAPESHEESSSVAPVAIAIIIVFFVIFLYYIMTNVKSGFNIPNVQIPSKIDVNINK